MAPSPYAIAAFQMEAVHEDLAAGFFKVFSDAGFGCNGYMTDRIYESRGSFFDTVSHPDVEVEFVHLEGRPAWDALADRVRAQDPKFLYFNTLQRDGIARWADQFDVPILGVVHNPYLFQKADDCRALGRAGKLDVFGLAPHVRRKLIECMPELEGRAHVHYPYVWMPEGRDKYSVDPDVLDIVIPGAVDFANRDFEGLLNYLSQENDTMARPVVFSILAGGPDRKKLEDIILDRNLERFFDMANLDPTSRRVPHSVYLERLYNCHAILPLLPVGRTDYVESKVTTGVMAGIGIGRPIITTEMVGKAYEFTPILVPDDRPFDLSQADISAPTLADRRDESLAIRQRALAHNDRIIRKVLASHAL